MLNNITMLIIVIGVSCLTACTQKNLKHPYITNNQNNIIKSDNVMRIATWSPSKFDGRFTAMAKGRLDNINNCLVLNTGNENLVLVLVDNSYSWDSNKKLLTMQNRSYKLGEEIYLGGGVFTYDVNNLPTPDINWHECGLNRGWLAS